MILKMEASYIGFRFEWHPEEKRLYAIKIGTTAAEQIAANIGTADAAQLGALLWSRGYRSREREMSRAPGAKHHHMMAENGIIGAKW